jgi:S1-C subfamily serine protease
VLTAAHVVEDSIGVSVSAGMETNDAEVIGLASEADIALLRATQPLSGHVFQFAEDQPMLAEDVAALGYPLDADLTFTSGRVSGIDREIDRGSYMLDDLLQTDAAINPGNSGGPLVNVAGEVVGVVSSKRLWVIGTADEDDISVEGTGYAVAASKAQQVAAELLENDSKVPLESCDDDLIREDLIEVIVTSDHADAPGVAQSLLVHGQAINNGAYDIAFDIFTEEMGKRLRGLEVWSAGLDTSYWRALSVDDVADVDGGLTADVALRTEQASEFGRDGQTCSDWSLRYSLIWDEGLWRIDGVSLPHGDPTPCE